MSTPPRVDALGKTWLGGGSTTEGMIMAGVPWWAQILGAVTAIGGTVATVLRQLWKSDYRAHRSDCKCSVCRERRRDAVARAEAWKRMQGGRKRARREKAEEMLYRIEHRSEDPERSAWYSTAELDANMRVEFRGTVYLIKEVKTNRNGYFIYMRNETTRVDFMTQVGFELASKRMWVPVGEWNRDPKNITPTPTWDVRIPVQNDGSLIYEDPQSFRPCIMEGCILPSGHEGECRFRNTGHSGV